MTGLVYAFHSVHSLAINLLISCFFFGTSWIDSVLLVLKNIV